MTAETCSVWLMPDPGWAGEFSRIVEALAGRFATPRFVPHLTLIGGRRFDVGDLGRRVAAALPGVAPIAQPIRDVVSGEAFFRSFYALFAAEGPLLALKHRIDRAVTGAAAADFMPHVSLLYGPVEAAAKAAAAAEMRTLLGGRSARFDRVEIVRSGDEVPIAEWRTLAAFALAG